MGDNPSLGATLRDLFPFGKEYEASKNEASRAAAPAHAHETKDAKSGEYSSSLCAGTDDLLSKEAFERYKHREVSINTKTNFLVTLNGYLGMVTRGLGSLAVLTFAASTPLVNIIPGVGAGAAAAASGALLPIALAALAFGVVTLAIGQYTTRMQTGKNTDNTDWFQRRSAQMIGKEVVRAQRLENEGHDASCQQGWSNKFQPRAEAQGWAQAVQAETAAQANAQRG